MNSKSFHSITYFPNGQVYDSNNWAISDLEEHCPADISKHLALDSVKRNEVISSPIGNLEFVWSASHIFGVSTFLRNGVTVNTGVYLPGVNEKEELGLLMFYLDSWRNFKVVKELCGDEIPFQSAGEVKERPLLISVNWATISKEDYDQIAYYDLFVASKYFE